MVAIKWWRVRAQWQGRRHNNGQWRQSDDDVARQWQVMGQRQWRLATMAMALASEGCGSPTKLAMKMLLLSPLPLITKWLPLHKFGSPTFAKLAKKGLMGFQKTPCENNQFLGLALSLLLWKSTHTGGKDDGTANAIADVVNCATKMQCVPCTCRQRPIQRMRYNDCTKRMEKNGGERKRALPFFPPKNGCEEGCWRSAPQFFFSFPKILSFLCLSPLQNWLFSCERKLLLSWKQPWLLLQSFSFTKEINLLLWETACNPKKRGEPLPIEEMTPLKRLIEITKPMYSQVF